MQRIVTVGGLLGGTAAGAFVNPAFANSSGENDNPLPSGFGFANSPILINPASPCAIVLIACTLGDAMTRPVAVAALRVAAATPCATGLSTTPAPLVAKAPAFCAAVNGMVLTASSPRVAGMNINRSIAVLNAKNPVSRGEKPAALASW